MIENKVFKSGFLQLFGFCFAFLSILVCFGQEVSVGEWRDYLPYQTAKQIVNADAYVYAVTDFALVEYSKVDGSYEKLSKVHGLSEIGVASAGYDPVSSTLIIGYTNGNLDLIQDNRIFNIADIKRSDILADKDINQVRMYDGFAWLATGFGIIQFNPSRKEIKETAFIGDGGSYVNVKDVCFYGDYIYAATTAGLRRADTTEPYLYDYRVWEPVNDYPGDGRSVSFLEVFNGKMLSNMDNEPNVADSLWQFDGANWSLVSATEDKKNYSATPVSNDLILVSHDGDVQFYNGNWEPGRKVFTYGDDAFIAPSDAAIDPDGTLYIADRTWCLAVSPREWDVTVYKPEGPLTTDAYNIHIQDETVWIGTGSRTNNYNKLFNPSGVYYQPNTVSSWNRISRDEFPMMEETFDYLVVAEDPFDPNHAFAGSLGSGILEIRDGEPVEFWDYTNSTLQRRNADSNWIFTGITGLTFDGDGNLWAANAYVPGAVSCYTQDGEWVGFDFSDILNEEPTGTILVTENDHKWIQLPNNGQGILVLDDGGTPTDLSDDQYRVLNGNTGQGGLPSTDIHSMAEDQDGEIWVGTDQGVAVFFNPFSVFSEGVNFDAQRIFVEVNGYTQYLLETEKIKAIEIDGANRKWFGTEGSGVFLMSEDGTEQIHHFTAENSPLFSNFILDIEAHPVSGEILIATEEGVVAYKGTATAPRQTMTEVEIYPNPVRETYTDLVSIRGLKVNSEVRITDVSGNVVFQTVSEGGQAIWNAKDMSGNRVATGVYLVFAADANGTESVVGKIAVIN